MKQVLAKLYNASPREVVDYLSRKIQPSRTNQTPNHVAAQLAQADQIASQLSEKFSAYQTQNLKTIDADAFQQHIESRIGQVDLETEGWSEEELGTQRDLSIKFHWGHNHDFGSFKQEGRMGDRHIKLMSNFLSLFPVTLEGISNKKVFDIGCWTGGTTLLLSALQNEVYAIEEVKKYAQMAQFLADSFGLNDRVSANAKSIYECNTPDMFNRFDLVYFPGVIYHLSDPVLALRILFNSLTIGGEILIESAGINHSGDYCQFDGSLVHHQGSRERLNRSGWNWFRPSPSAMARMMREAGFDDVQTLWHEPTRRVFGYGKKTSQVVICKAGLSVPDIR